MKKKIIPVIVLLIIGTSVAYFNFIKKIDDGFYGNVELNYVSLAFIDSGRITNIFVNEGDRVAKGQKLAEIDPYRTKMMLSEAKAEYLAASQTLKKLQNGFLPEEIERAESNVRQPKAQAELAKQTYDRRKNIYKESTGVSKQDLEIVETSKIAADEAYYKAQKDLALMKKGSRDEDIKQAQYKLNAVNSKIALLERQLQDTILLAPTDGVINSRMLEIGEIAMPQKPVLKLALTNNIWIRAYVAEATLGKINIGDTMKIYTDSYPEQPLTGKISYISDKTEFTPKTVQTEELRSALVYLIKIAVEDPQYLKQGMPVTVKY